MQQNRLLSLWQHVHYKKQWTLAALAVLLACCAIVSTVAWLTKSDETANGFTVGEVSAQVEETFELPYSTKSDVKVTNTGTVPVYVRACVSIYLQKTDKTILAEEPQSGTDYTIEWGDLENWKEVDGIYYYKSKLPAGESTSALIKRVTQRNNTGGVQLVVDVATQVIQADPAEAVEQAWRLTPNKDGTLPIGG